MTPLLARSLSVTVVFIAACGPGSRNGGNGGGGGGGSGDGGPDGCVDTCSADLRDILDCNGNVVGTCPANQGCAGGTCIEPCDAAAQGKTSIGCEYYAVDPDVIMEGVGGCFAAYVANTWDQPVTIAVDRGGTQLKVDAFTRVPSGQGQGLTYAPLPNGELAPGQVAILFLSQGGGLLGGVACPSGITPGISGDAAVHGTGMGQAFHIKTSAPVVAYDIFPYGGGNSAATSATLLLPTSAWDTSYIAVDAFRKSTIVPDGQPFIEIVGQATSTDVTLRPTAAVVGGGGIGVAAQGSSVTYRIGPGQVLQFTQDAELEGSPITATQPVGVWGGATCLSIDVNEDACDSAHQEIPPLRALGHRYAAVRYRNRYAGQEETVPWRIVGSVAGTTLTYSPSTPAGAPTTLAVGQIAEFESPGPFYVESQDADHPFYMSAHMTGWSVVNGGSSDHRGDPEFVNIIPPEQYLSAYTFFTDPTYPETNLVLTRERKKGQFADVTVDCSGTVTGWTAVDAADTIEYARVDLVTGNFQSVAGCNNGVHHATSKQPFGLVVWGWGSAASVGFFSQAVSYAYPAGAGVKPINSVVLQ